MSTETAVSFEPCHLRRRVAAERSYICERFGAEHVNWREELHYTSTKRQSVWVIRTDDGERREVYFETAGTIYDQE